MFRKPNFNRLEFEFTGHVAGTKFSGLTFKLRVIKCLQEKQKYPVTVFARKTKVSWYSVLQKKKSIM